MALMLVIGFAGMANALEVTANTAEVGYTGAEFRVYATDVTDTVVKIILFYTKASDEASMDRMDSIYTDVAYDANGDTITLSYDGTLEQGTEYLWYVTVEDTLETVRYPSLVSNPDRPYLSFTTDDYVQINNLVAGANSYTTAIIETDSILAGLVDSVRLHMTKLPTAITYKASITTVTDPDSFSITGLDEGVTYYYKTIAYIADSGIVDTSVIQSFTTTDLTVGLSVIPLAFDSIGIIVDTSAIIVDSIIFQNGAGIVTALAETLTTVTGVDTFYVVNTIEGGTYSYRVLAFLPDSGATCIETTTTATYTRPHNDLINSLALDRDHLGSNYTAFLNWDFDNTADNYTTGKLPIKTNWMRVHAIIDGEDDAHTFDSLQVFLWTWVWGDSIIIDTISAMENDTATITPLKYRMGPGEITDSSMVYFPQYNWGQFFSISAVMTDSSGTYDIGTRGVHVIVEEIE